MRITGGIHKGRLLAAPEGRDVRPTQDRVREALFNILMHDIVGMRFLDLFAGSGAVGLDALSRGAASATFVEANPRHAAFIRSNAAALRLSPEIVQADVESYLATFGGAQPFDVAFADPPYELGVEKGYAAVLATLATRNVVRPGGLFVAELTSRQAPEESSAWDLCRDRVYGQTRLAVYRRK